MASRWRTLFAQAHEAVHQAAHQSFIIRIMAILTSSAQSRSFTISANICDVVTGEIFPGTVVVRQGRVASVTRSQGEFSTYLMPGFVDAHVHIESSMLVPSEFARVAVIHGTVATVSDPHEIANVLGVAGVEYMIENGKKVPFKFNFGAPSCVPATSFETAGATIGVEETAQLLGKPEIRYLSEMMNYPGVLHSDPEVMAKIAAAHQRSKPVDGHAPGVRGEAIRAYVAAGITTDHECFQLDEAQEKLELGMKILIREGSAAKNFDALHPILANHANRCMFCSDDKHPDDLVLGHINHHVRRAVELGYDRMSMIRCATLNPVRHYQLDVGLLQPGDPADFIEVANLDDFSVLRTWIEGRLVAESGATRIASVPVIPVNNFRPNLVSPSDFALPDRGGRINVIEAVDGQLVTNRLVIEPTVRNGMIVADPELDILKIAVVNRYRPAPVSVGFIKNFGLKQGAIAGSVAHDSHNVLAVGTTDQELADAINMVMEQRGGLALVAQGIQSVLPLPVAGLMSAGDAWNVANQYSNLVQQTRQLGTTLHSPFMTLSFMALLVIPKLKLSDLGLFDGEKFGMIGLQE